MGKVKELFGKIHLWLGLVSGAVVFLVSVTGCLYVFEEEIRSFQYQDRYELGHIPDSQKLSVGTLSEIVFKSAVGAEVKKIDWYPEANRNYTVHLEEGRRAYINPYDGNMSDVHDPDWLWYVEKLHTSLLLGEFGKWVIRINILVFLILLLTGIYLWWPAKKARRKQAFSLKTNGSFKRLNYDLHSVLGFYGLLVLLVITLSGMWWSFDWYKQTVFGLLGEKYEKPNPVMIDDLNSSLDWKNKQVLDEVFETSMLRYPGAKTAHIEKGKNIGLASRIRLEYPSGLYKKRNEIFYHPAKGEIVETRLYKDYTAGEIYKHANYEIHTGRGFGILGKIIAFMASLLAASLPVSGFYIWYGRTYKKRKKLPTSKAREGLRIVINKLELANE